MRAKAAENPNVQVLVRCVKFADDAQWHVAVATPVDQFVWTDLTTGVRTHMGAAISLVAQQLAMPPMTNRAFPPVLVLVSDGQPNDDFDQGLRELMALPWGIRAVRMAVAIGNDADHGVLTKFIGNPEIPVFQANNPEALARFITWVSTAVIQDVSQPPSQPHGSKPSGGVVITGRPDAAIAANTDHVW
jgi:uncharacterized protein YegL